MSKFTQKLKGAGTHQKRQSLNMSDLAFKAELMDAPCHFYAMNLSPSLINTHHFYKPKGTHDLDTHKGRQHAHVASESIPKIL